MKDRENGVTKSNFNISFEMILIKLKIDNFSNSYTAHIHQTPEIHSLQSVLQSVNENINQIFMMICHFQVLNYLHLFIFLFEFYNILLHVQST